MAIQAFSWLNKYSSHSSTNSFIGNKKNDKIYQQFNKSYSLKCLLIQKPIVLSYDSYKTWINWMISRLENFYELFIYIFSTNLIIDYNVFTVESQESRHLVFLTNTQKTTSYLMFSQLSSKVVFYVSIQLT